MAINIIGSRSASGTLPVGVRVDGLISDPAYLPMDGRIVNRADYPKLYTALGTIPKPFLEDVAVPAFGSTEVYDITFGNSKYVAIGEGGKFATSPDAVTWTLQAGSITATLLSFANGIFYAGGTGGKLYSSTDGITWTQRLSVSGNVFGRVIYNGSNGYFVIGTNGDVYSSTNGTSWAVDYTENPTTANGQYVSDVVWNPTTNRLCYLIHSGGSMSLASLVWSGSDLTLDSYQTPDIELLSTQPYPTNIVKFSVTYVTTGRLVGSSNYKILTSNDLVNWNENPSFSVSASSLTTRLVVDGSTRIALAYNQKLLTSQYAGMAINPWTSQVLPFSGSTVKGIARGTSSWGAVAAGNKVASADNTASTWTLQTSPFTATSAIQINDVTNDGVSTWILAGASGKVAWSSGGESWTESVTGLVNSISGVCHGESTTVLATTSEVPKYSTDLVNWTNCTGLPSSTYSNPRFANGKFVISRGASGMYYSDDGITWTISSPVFQALSLARNSPIFVAVTNTTIYTSSDGSVWTPYVHGTGIVLSKVFYNGTYYLACPTSGTSLLRSVDAISWEVVTVTSVNVASCSGGLFWSTTNTVSEDGVDWFSSDYEITTNSAGIGKTVIAAELGKILKGVSYNYNTDEEIYIPSTAQFAESKAYVKAK